MKFLRRLALIIAAAVMFTAVFSLSASAAAPLGSPDSAAPVRPAVKSAPKLKLQTSYGTIRVSWDKVRNAEKYIIYRQQEDGSFKKMLATKKTAFTVKNVSSEKEQTYKVMAVKGTKGYSSTIKAKSSPIQAFVLKGDSAAYSGVNKVINNVTLRSGYYTGYYDDIDFPGYCVLFVRNTRCLVKENAVKAAGSNYHGLPCASISQVDGSVYHGYACGPGAATIFVASTLGIQLSVEQTIADAQRYGVTVYSDYTFLNDGMPMKGVQELVAAELKKNGSDKNVRVIDSSSYSAAKIAKQIKNLIDGGSRVLVCLTESHSLENGRMVFNYTNGGVTHYAVITGYEMTSDSTYDFYIGDSWYYENDAYEYARDHNNRNRTTARYYYGLGRCSSGDLGRSVKAAANISSDFAGLVYVE